MELKGFIIIPHTGWDKDRKDTISLHCCRSVTDVHINEVSLYEKLSAAFDNPDAEKFFEDYDKPPLPETAVKYVILDNEPDSKLSFNDVCVSAIDGMLACEHESGCYSEYTCGYGGFDFLVNQHSIFEELEAHEGKFIWLQI